MAGSDGRDMAGRRVVITGANTGIGRAAAAALAARGARVVMAGRNEAATRDAMGEIAATTGSDELAFVPLDLADLASVRRAAALLTDDDEPIHVLVANAGLAGQRGTTAQGFELAFGTNHLGHFLLTTLLLERLRASAPARVVVVASDSHRQASGIPFEQLRHPTRTITGMPEYAVSKLANVVFAQELARRVPSGEVATAALHPGVIASDVWRRVPWPVRPVMTRFMKSTTEGAETSVHCATVADLAAVSGSYYTDRRIVAPNPAATPALGGELWERSEAWVAEAG